MSSQISLSQSTLAQSYVRTLLAGNRPAARQLIEETLECGVEASDILGKLIWPVMEEIQASFRSNGISTIQLNMATRLNRMMADQLTAKLSPATANGKRVIVACGDAEPEELGGQICADLFETAGWEVKFIGGGVANDEVLALLGEFRPNLLCLFATRAAGMPNVRSLIDYLREVNCCPEMQVMCAGGIYQRAEGLAEEIGADLYAADAVTAVATAAQEPTRRASLEQQTVGRMRRIRKAAHRRVASEGVSVSDIAEAA